MDWREPKLKQNRRRKVSQASLHGRYRVAEVGKALLSQRCEKRRNRGAVRVGFFIHFLNYSLPLFFLVLSLPTCVCLTTLPRYNSHMIQFTHLNYTVPLVPSLSSVVAPIITAYEHFDIWLFPCLHPLATTFLLFLLFKLFCSAIYVCMCVFYFEVSSSPCWPQIAM